MKDAKPYKVPGDDLNELRKDIDRMDAAVSLMDEIVALEEETEKTLTKAQMEGFQSTRKLIHMMRLERNSRYAILNKRRIHEEVEECP